MRNLYYLIVLTRVLSPLIIFVNAPVASVISLLLDICDGPIAYRSKLSWDRYNLIDKILDNLWYIAITAFMFYTPLRYIFLGLLLYRLIALPLVHITKNESLYILFPNILEWWFYFYLIYPALAATPTAFLISLSISMVVEWNTHIGKTSLIARNIFRTNMKWKGKRR